MQATPSKTLCSLGGTTVSTECHTTPRKNSFEEYQCSEWNAHMSPKRVLPASPSDRYYDCLRQAPRKGVNAASTFTDADHLTLRRRLFYGADEDQNTTEISLAEFKLIPEEPAFVVVPATEAYATRLF